MADNLHDILVDGFLAHTFSPQDAHTLFSRLLRTPDFLRYYRVTYSQGVWHIMQNAPSSYVQQASLGLPTQNFPLPLDFSTRTTQGTVVPQPRWVPADDVDVRRHVHDATLQLPIFFVNRNNGAVGFWLPHILQGRDGDLHNRDSHASLGGRTTTHIRINVSPHSYISCEGSHLSPTPPQWPGYGGWKRQIPTRDETFNRNPITVGRFMRHVGSSVNKFFDVSILPLSSSPALITFLLL